MRINEASEGDNDNEDDDVIFEVPRRRDSVVYNVIMEQQEVAPTTATNATTKGGQASMEIVDFDQAETEMQEQWMRVFNNNILNGQEIDKEQYPKEIWRHLSFIQDAKGYLLLHHACRNKASLDTIQWFIAAGGGAGGDCDEEDKNDVVTLGHQAADGSLPIHIVCRCYPNFELVKLVSKDSSGRNFLNVPDGNRDFPLDLVNDAGDDDSIAANNKNSSSSNKTKVVHFLVENSPAVLEFTASMFEELLNDSRGDQEEIFQAMDSICNNCDPKKFQKIVRKHLKQRVCIEWLTWSFCQQNVIFTVMRDFYCQVVWIVLLFRASHLYLNEKSPDIYVYPLYVFSAVFMAKEICQVRRYIRADVLSGYMNVFWNWLDWMTILLVLASSITLQLVDPSDSTLYHDKAVRNLLMVTGACQVTHFASFLKKIFLPFATFVGGLTSVFKTIVPFMVCSALVLLAFAFMYYVDRFDLETSMMMMEEEEDSQRRSLQRRSDGSDELDFSTMWVSFRSTFQMFLQPPETTMDVLDASFGIITNIILLNVVIAVVSIAWDKSSEEEKAKEVFWEYRLTFIQDINLSQKAKNTGRSSLYVNRNVSRRLDRSRSKAKERWADRSGRGGIWLHIQYAVQYAIFFILGLVSFGLLWPSKIKRDIFGVRFKDVLDNEEVEHLETTQYREAVTKQIKDLDTKMQNQIEDNLLLIKENQSLNKKIDRLESSIEKLDALLNQMLLSTHKNPTTSSATSERTDTNGPAKDENAATDQTILVPRFSKIIQPSDRRLPFLPDDDSDDDDDSEDDDESKEEYREPSLHRRTVRQPSDGFRSPLESSSRQDVSNRTTSSLRRRFPIHEYDENSAILPSIPDDDDESSSSTSRHPNQSSTSSPQRGASLGSPTESGTRSSDDEDETAVHWT